MKEIGLASTGFFLPEQKLTNADLEKMVDTTDEWIVSRTGISERRIAPLEIRPSFMAAQAAERAFNQAGLAPADIAFVISSTCSHEYNCPSQAAKVAQFLRLDKCFCFDLNAACSGFVYALAVGSSLLQTGGGRFGIVTAAEKMSALTDYTDRASCVLFGDGAGAAVLTTEPPYHRIIFSELGADPSGADLVVMGGRDQFGTGENYYFWQDGRGVFRFAVTKLKELIPRALARLALKPEDRYYIIPHQANQRMMENVAADLGLPPERFINNIETHGNTSSASIAIALGEAAAAGRFAPGDKLIFIGFGGGLTWGTMAIEW